MALGHGIGSAVVGKTLLLLGRRTAPLPSLRRLAIRGQPEWCGAPPHGVLQSGCPVIRPIRRIRSPGGTGVLVVVVEIPQFLPFSTMLLLTSLSPTLAAHILDAPPRLCLQEAAHLISLRLASLEGQSKVHVYVVQELVSELRSLVMHTPPPRATHSPPGDPRCVHNVTAARDSAGT